MALFLLPYTTPEPMADEATKEPSSREEWEAMIAEETELFTSTVSPESRDQDGPSEAPAARDEEDEDDAPSDDEDENEPGDEPQPDEDPDDDEGDDPDAAEPSDGGEATDEDEDEPAAAVTAPQDTSSTEAKPEAPTIQPFVPKADKKEFALDRAVLTRVRNEKGEDEEYIVLPRSTWDRQIQPNFRDQAAIQQRELELRRENAALAPQNNAEVIFARNLTRKLDELMRSDSDDWDEALIDYALEYRKELPALLEKAQQEGETAASNARNSVRPDDEIEAELAQLQTSFEATLTGTVDELLAQESYRGINKDDLLEDLIEDYGLGLFFQADRDYPEFGVKQGSWALRSDVIEQRLEREAKRLQRKVAASSRAKEVQQRNAERVGGQRVRASVTGAQNAAASGNSHTPKKITSRAEWEASLHDEFNI